ncbi:hypothetical protein K2X33_00895 [bacterium]|nr:hypothetical protein [bacterium]
MKATFEPLFPIEQHSIAARYPKIYARIMRLFEDRPSYLQALNRGTLPDAGTLMTTLIDRITEFAFNIGEDLEGIIKDVPGTSTAHPILHSYVNLFKSAQPRCRVGPSEVFDPKSKEQYAKILRHGKKAICSIWSEFRLSLRIGQLSRVNTYVEDLIADGVLNNDDGFFDPYLNQELDQLWFPQFSPFPNDEDWGDSGRPRPARNYQPDAVALAEVKVFDSQFTNRSNNRRDVHQQFRRYLNIISAIGHRMVLKPQIYYFFIAGIDRRQIAEFHRMTEEFNRSLATQTPVRQVPVEIFIYGDYDAPLSATP